METRIDETVKGLIFCGKGDKIGQTYTRAVSSAAKWNIQDPYSRLRVEEHHFVLDDEELMPRVIRAGIDWTYIGYTKKAGLVSHLLDHFKEDGMNIFQVFFWIFLMPNFQMPSIIRY